MSLSILPARDFCGLAPQKSRAEESKFQTCMNTGSVCKAFSTSRRREVLSFRHHEVVASLPPEQADALLDWCEAPLKNGRK
jgi:hypothetical protein